MDDQENYKDVLLEVAREVYSLVFGDNRDETLLQRLRDALRDFADQEKKHRDYMRGQSVVSSDMQIPDEYKSFVTKYFRPDRKVTPPAALSTFTYKDEEGKENVVKSRSVYTHHRIVQSPSELTKVEAEQRDLVMLSCVYDNHRLLLGAIKENRINDSIVPEDTYEDVWRYISGEPYFYEGKAEFVRSALKSIRYEEKEQNATPAKYWGIGAWLWKLYERTLKVVVDAVLEKLWPK